LKIYVLVGHDSNMAPSPQRMRWMEFARIRCERIVAQAEIGEMFVSTVFLGRSHSVDSVSGSPYETMVIGVRPEPVKLWRYPSWNEAERGHRRVCKLLRKLDQASKRARAGALSERRVK
jgi:hypothetical protein